jgi:hypothetical protein
MTEASVEKSQKRNEQKKNKKKKTKKKKRHLCLTYMQV